MKIFYIFLPVSFMLIFSYKTLPAQAGHVVISEIRYDERSGINEEFVELYNPASDLINLENWSIVYKSKTGSKWYTKIIFSENQIIPAYGFFLWGGDSLDIQADAVEENKQSLGLANSGGHIALLDSVGQTVDLVAWEGGDSPEGSGDAGKTEDGGSLERKAYESSTAESMQKGGPDQSSGNGYDTDNNQEDFVVQGPEAANPQNTLSPPEPPGKAPQFVTGPEVCNWYESGVRIRWETDSLSTAQLLYGPTLEYSDTVNITEPARNHLIDLSGLNTAGVYHYTLIVKNASRENRGEDHLFITRSHSESTGEINVYFNGSVENAGPDYKAASGNQNLSELLIRRIDQSHYSIDACFYNMSDWDVQDALVRACERGVRVRFIFDADHDLSAISRIQDAGIPVIQDNFGDNLSEGIMHHKFAVFDHRNQTSFSDDWVWTGSFNPNYYGNYPVPFENSIEIQDEALAEIYTREFEEMWGSDTATPDQASSRFGIRKTNDIPHLIMVKETRIRVYMSPSDQTTDALISAIQNAGQSLCFAVYSFTRDDIAQAMYNKWSGSDGFRLCGVFDSEQQDNDGSYSQWAKMNAWVPVPDVFLDTENGTLHHKYMIIDHDGENPVLITGSQNWSDSGEIKNDENVLIIQNKIVCGQYLQEFAARYHAAGGGEDLTASLVQNKHSVKSPRIVMYPNFPDPFNGQTLIRYRLEEKQRVRLLIFDVTGRLIKCLKDKLQPAGIHIVVWDGTSAAARPAPSGIYMLCLYGNHFFRSEKMILLR